MAVHTRDHLVSYNQMVVDSLRAKRADHSVDVLFHALSDTTRRDILRCVGGGEYSVSQLAERYPMTFAAVQKHVALLERAGLVRKKRRGREQIVHAHDEGLARAQRVLDDLEDLWRGRIDRMSDLLTAESPSTKGTTQ